MEEIKQDNAIVPQENVETPQENDVIKNTVNAEYQKKLEEYKKDKEFQNNIQQVVGFKTKTLLRADLLKALNDEQKNQLIQYEIDCEKEKLEYRKKHEKKVIYEEVQAEVQEKRINALKKRYGYLYELDENGQPKKFIASKFVNKYKEICNWYDGTSQGFKKIVTSTLRICFYALLVYLAYKGFVWLSHNLPEILESTPIK